MKPFKTILLAGLTAVLPLCAHAQTDALIEGAKQCTRQLTRYEREYGIPAHLLSAIATTESGRYHKGLKISVPWPWSINAEGKGYIFDSKEEAIAAVRRLRATGARSIDVGCMQVNLHHHPEAFASLEEAFEPENNVAYAASFLRSLYQEGGSWKQAAANYHSKTPSLGGKYVGLVYNSWYTIIDKLRSARIATPSPAEATASAPVQLASNTVTPVVAAPAAVPAYSRIERGTDTIATPIMSKPVAIKTAAAPNNPARSSYKSPRMNSIQVSSAETRAHDNDVLVVDTAAKPMQPVAAVVANVATPQVIDVGAQQAAIPVTTRRTGPNFIFSN